MLSQKKILVLGASGMLGNAAFRILSENSEFQVRGTIRSGEYLRFFTKTESERIISNVDVLNDDELIRLFSNVRPDVVVNCVGIIKQQKLAKDPLAVLPINSLLPHRLSNLCKLIGARLILTSTDCVFDGKKGNYTETDIPDADDLYGRSKLIGEIGDQSHVFTIRTSIIGHELNSNYSLVDWFLSQEGEVKGYKKAIFSGFPSIEIAEIIKNVIIPNSKLHGLYHISSNPISKFDLLALVGEIYGRNNKISESEEVIVNRSLDSTKFKKETSYEPLPWRELILLMKKYKEQYLDSAHV
ncbi:NAD(P)-dependent oxidoreductase [Leptospira yasudae]|uniref:dTDP-4-dehydrorhamnose reductase family protein n=1 Tax=Leptospira yasudae TaxID=2202201 RepID=UPI000E59ADBF|nr:SDR family oxidoreductase [Leptospira yasudae]RHX91210.1 NAD(P)-dependent oxidoreductase [Leptospira yasudae]